MHTFAQTSNGGRSATLAYVYRSLVVVFLAILLPLSAHAQVLYGSLVGTISDSTQAAVGGALVRVTDQGTNLTRSVSTTDAGYYSFETLQPGKYAITVQHEGFKEVTRRDVDVPQNGSVRVDLTLEVGAVSEKIEVSALAPLLQTESAEVRHEVTTMRLEELPVNPGRNYENMLGTLPGFTPPTSQKAIASDPSRSMNFYVNGTNSMTKNTRIDGASQTNIWLPDSTAYIPALEAISSVNVVTNSFDAEQGLAGGVSINVVIKSGTNQFHGSAFEFHNDTAMKAKPVLLPAGQAKPSNIFNQFGATAGGPIKKDKLFYFLSYEGNYYNTTGSVFATVPTTSMVSGDLSASPTPIYNPFSGNADGTGRVPFQNNKIPSSMFDPIIQKILPMIPAPNQPGLLTSNYFATAPYDMSRHIGDAKINWNPTSKLTVSGRVGILRYTGLDAEIFGQLGGPPVVRNPEGDPGNDYGGTYNTTIAGSYVVSPKFIVDTYWGWTRMTTADVQNRVNEKVGQDLGIPGTNGPRFFEGGWPRFIAGWTGIQTSDFSVFGTCCPWMPYFRRDPQWNYVANAGWNKGSHNLRFGFEYVHQSLNAVQAEFPGVADHGPQGGFGMTGGPTSLKGGPSSNLFNEWGTFLLGLSSFTGRNLQVPDTLTTRAHFYGLFFQDKWQATPKLTVSMGVRWEHYPFPTRADRGVERYNFANNQMMVCGIGSVPEDCGVNVSDKQFAPRVGIAYRVTPTFVIRTGFGLAWDPFALARQFRTNYPSLVALNINSTNAYGWSTKVVDGIPAIPNPDLGNGIIPMPGNVGLTAAPADLQRGYILSWNFTLQKQLWNNWSVQAGYVATRQVKEIGLVDLNAGQVPGLGAAGQPLYQQFGRTAISNLLEPIGNSHYDSLQLTAEHRFAHGLTWNLAYTWSKAIGVCCQTTDSGNPAINAAAYQNLNRALLPFNIPNYVSSTFIYALPFGHDRPLLSNGGVASAILGGWQVTGNFSSISGLPFTVSSSNTSLNMPNNSQRANIVKSNVAILGGTGPGQSYFDPLAFAPVTTANFGTAAFDILKGPTTVNFDAGLTRVFRLNERFGLQFRAEAFNATNTPHWANPAANVSTMSLNPGGTIKSLGGFSTITSTRANGRENIDERVLRLALHLSF